MTRVIQWATGITGTMALRHVIGRSDLEVVGVRVYDPAKVGVDAGALCGLPDVGVRAIDDRDALINADADVVLYMGKVETDTPGCFADVCDLLASGKDVVATGSRFIHPRSLDPSLADGIENACRAGSSSFLGLGLFPGFVGEAVAPLLSRLTQRTGRINVCEVLNYSTYASHDLIFNAMGFGHDPDDTTPLLSNTEYAAGAWIGSATVLAQAMGLEIRGVEGYREVSTTPRALSVAAGEIPAGTVGAMRFGVVVDCGETTLTVEHLTRMADDLVPDWPTEIGYEVTFEGEPNLRFHLTIGSDREDHAEQGCLATAMHAINAIPTVLAAQPGLYDLSTITPFVATRKAIRIMTELEDRQDISDVINRFATGIDSRDFSLFRKVFTDDCHVVMGDYGSFVGVDAIARFEEDSHAQAGHTLHRMTNHVIDVEGDQASAKSYVDAWITSMDNASGINAIGFYDDELVRTDQGWRIARRTFTQVRLTVSNP